MWCTHTIECYSAIRKNEIMPFATTWVDLEIIIGREEVRQGKTNTAWQHVHVESKLWRKWTHLWNRNRLRDRADVGLPRGGVYWRGTEWESGVSRCKLVHIEWINDKVLLLLQGSCIQHLVINHNGKELRKKVSICATGSLYYTAEINIVNQLCFNKEKRGKKRTWAWRHIVYQEFQGVQGSWIIYALG